MSKEKKISKKELQAIKMQLISMHDSNETRFCRRCEEFTGPYPELNCAQGRFWEFTKRKKQAQIYFVAEAPGKDEIADPEGRFLIGRSGQEFERWLEEANINKKDVYVDNVVRCALPHDLGLPQDIGGFSTVQKKKIINNCKPYLFAELERLKPKVVVLMGNTAMQAVLGFSGVHRWRGRLIKHRGMNCYILPLLHPAAILRGQRWLRQEIIESLSILPALLKAPIVFEQFKHKLILDERNLKSCLAQLSKVSEIVIDLETNSLNNYSEDSNIIGIALSCSRKVGYFLPLFEMCEQSEEDESRWNFEKPLWTKRQLSELYGILKSKKILKIFHNAAFDVNWLISKGFDVQTPIFDTMIVNSVLDHIDNGLKALSYLHTDFGGYENELEELLNKGRQKIGYHKVDPYVLSKYAAYDSLATYRVREIQKKQLQKHNAQLIVQELMEFRYNLSEMELIGCRIDLKKSKNLKKEYEKKLERIELSLQKELGTRNLNINSPIQLVKLLFSEGGVLYDFRKTPSTSIQILRSIKFQVEKSKKFKTLKKQNITKVIDLILDYRKYTKLISTYLNMFMAEHIEERIHPHYTLDVTATGRPSCKKPNLTNIPRKGGIRDCFIADKGCVLGEVDLSQIELRVAAEYARDQKMLEILNDRKGDIHAQVGLASFKQPDGSDYDITRFKDGEPRAGAKIISFSVLYGKTTMGLAADLNCTIAEATRIQNFFYEGFPQLKKWIDQQQAFVSKYGYVETLFGRKLMIESALSNNHVDIEAAYRKCVNYPIQSSASDILVLAFNRLKRRIKKEKLPIQILMTVYDSILYNVPKQFKKECKQIMLDEMERSIPQVQYVKVFADYKEGYRWGMMH